MTQLLHYRSLQSLLLRKGESNSLTQKKVIDVQN